MESEIFVTLLGAQHCYIAIRDHQAGMESCGYACRSVASGEGVHPAQAKARRRLLDIWETYKLVENGQLGLEPYIRSTGS